MKRLKERVLYKAFHVMEDGILTASQQKVEYKSKRGKILTVKNAIGFVAEPLDPNHIQRCAWGYHAGTLRGWHGFPDERHVRRDVKSGNFAAHYAIYKVLLSGIDTSGPAERWPIDKWVGTSFKILKRVDR